jgi:hypothetical protein
MMYSIVDELDGIEMIGEDRGRGRWGRSGGEKNG